MFLKDMLYDFWLSIVHRCALLGNMSARVLRRVDDAQCPTGYS
jgi:hypothetical protein